MKRKLFSKTIGVPGGLAIGVLISLVFTLIGAAVIASLLSAEKTGESGVPYMTLILCGIAAMIGAWSAFKIVKRLRLQICLLTGGCYYACLMGMTALFFGGRYSSLGITALAVLVGCAIVALLPTSKGRSWKKGRKGYR